MRWWSVSLDEKDDRLDNSLFTNKASALRAKRSRSLRSGSRQFRRVRAVAVRKERGSRGLAVAGQQTAFRVLGLLRPQTPADASAGDKIEPKDRAKFRDQYSSRWRCHAQSMAAERCCRKE
jgi:hypothetical protein